MMRNADDQQETGKKMQAYVDAGLSLWAMWVTNAVPNRCFDNAWRAYCSTPALFLHGTFVEGWIVFDLEGEVVLNEHGWCELPDGTIVDPSIVLLVEPDLPVYYFPGVRRHWQEMESLIQQGRDFPSVRFDGEHGVDGLGDPAYKVAHDAAIRTVRRLAQAVQPAKEMTFLCAQDGGPDPRDEIAQALQVSPDYEVQ